MELSTDYDDILYCIEEKACAVGMLPSQFWEEEPFDTLIYIEQRVKQQQIDAYNLSLVTANMNGVNLANAFRDKGAQVIEYPKIWELFDIEKPKDEVDAFALRKNQLRARLATRRK